MKITSQKIRDAARGQDCTINIAGVCMYDSATTVFCHFPDEHNGMGTKASDISGGFGCDLCHSALDGRHPQNAPSQVDAEFYMRRSQTRTLARLVEMGIVKVHGFDA